MVLPLVRSKMAKFHYKLTTLIRGADSSRHTEIAKTASIFGIWPVRTQKLHCTHELIEFVFSRTSTIESLVRMIAGVVVAIQFNQVAGIHSSP